jgi:hypothetical protein
LTAYALYSPNIRASWLPERVAGRQKCAQEIAIHRLDGSPPSVFEINQGLKERRSRAQPSARSIVIDSQADLAASIIAII